MLRLHARTAEGSMLRLNALKNRTLAAGVGRADDECKQRQVSLAAGVVGRIRQLQCFMEQLWNDAMTLEDETDRGRSSAFCSVLDTTWTPGRNEAILTHLAAYRREKSVR